ncbi:glycosyltransferase [Lacipirellula limnantheis]|uniref:Poly-beta-1,6-N-acetyl-D-glucosamine synthase n=1 Tax=Lacipirellula limnantheis TaxID=2528024 RepID=A0A517TY90_9BACT|nr:glycosyltransferase [Lacipirellula limnantheis]QDT73348.1 Poly-beta-1,6-N-acetyl-D-glucosamine synthase [Lacipirellula limnantheis]
MSTIFWLSVTAVAYTYIVYPAAIYFCARLAAKPHNCDGTACAGVSVLIAGHQEREKILEKLVCLCKQLSDSKMRGEIIVVLDGIGSSPSGIGEYLNKKVTDERIKIINLSCNIGKAAAISTGAAEAKYDVLVLSDIRQRWRPDALSLLVESFRDANVGAVSGELVLESQEGIAGGVGLYWKYERWLRHQESLYDSVTGVTGAICAVRSELFEPVPAGTILDDVYWPLKVVMKGFRVLHLPDAIAYDRLPSHAKDEFRRKVRTLCGNFQLMTLLPEAVYPWRNRLWWQFISHKLLRLVAPWALLGILASSALIDGPFYRWAFWAQAAVYGITLIMMLSGQAKRVRLIAAAAAFLLLNFAAWVAFWVWISGREANAWKSVNYNDLAGDRPKN